MRLGRYLGAWIPSKGFNPSHGPQSWPWWRVFSHIDRRPRGVQA